METGELKPNPPPFFLATARGGHSADPAARCPHCGGLAGMHRGVDLEGSAWFPLRAVICEVPEVVGTALPAETFVGSSQAYVALPEACATCGDARWLGDGYRQPCPECNAEGKP